MLAFLSYFIMLAFYTLAFYTLAFYMLAFYTLAFYTLAFFEIHPWDPNWRHGGVITCISQYLRSSLKAWGCGYLYFPVLEILAEGMEVSLPVFASTWDPRWRHGCTSHQLYVNILISLQKYYYIWQLISQKIVFSQKKIF